MIRLREKVGKANPRREGCGGNKCTCKIIMSSLLTPEEVICITQFPYYLSHVCSIANQNIYHKLMYSIYLGEVVADVTNGRYMKLTT